MCVQTSLFANVWSCKFHLGENLNKITVRKKNRKATLHITVCCQQCNNSTYTPLSLSKTCFPKNRPKIAETSDSVTKPTLVAENSKK